MKKFDINIELEDHDEYFNRDKEAIKKFILSRLERTESTRIYITNITVKELK